MFTNIEIKQEVIEENKPKRKRTSISLATKLQVIKRIEAGETQTSIGNSLNIPTSTIRTILKNTSRIKSSVTTTSKLSATKVTHSRNPLLEEMEKRLCIWMEYQNQRNIPVNRSAIMERARSIFGNIQEEWGDTNDKFIASKGWYDRFKNRSNVRTIRVTKEAAEKRNKSVQDFPKTLQTIIEAGSYPPDLVFHVGESDLFWKRIPSRNLPSEKDRFTIFLGGNAKGDFKLKPLLVYHSEAPSSIKGIFKSSLPVIWESNEQVWLTTDIFRKWFISHFCPSVKRYCETRGFEPKALLLFDNAPHHPDNLEELQTCLSVKVVFLPPKTNVLLQPMKQRMISKFKAYYLRHTLRQLKEKTNESDNQDISQFWKDYNIMNAIDNIKLAWDEVTENAVNGVWKKLWPEICKNYIAERSIIDSIVDLANDIGLLDVREEEVKEWLQQDGESLSNEDLRDLSEQDVQIKLETLFSTEETKRELETDFLSVSVTTITKIMNQLLEYDPDYNRSSRAKRGVMEAITCYRELLRERKRKLERSVEVCTHKVTKHTEESEPGPSSK